MSRWIHKHGFYVQYKLESNNDNNNVDDDDDGDLNHVELAETNPAIVSAFSHSQEMIITLIFIYSFLFSGISLV